MYSMKLEWKEFNVSLASIDAFCKAQSEDYTGNSADSALTLWFENEPSEEIKEVIQAKWDSIESDDVEATAYKNAEEIQAEVEIKKTSAKSKLLALGLTEEEIAALSL